MYKDSLDHVTHDVWLPNMPYADMVLTVMSTQTYTTYNFRHPADSDSLITALQLVCSWFVRCSPSLSTSAAHFLASSLSTQWSGFLH